MKERSAFRNIAVGLVVIWLTLFALIPNLMVAVVSLLQRDERHFIAPTLSLESYARLLDPLYLNVFTDSLGLALLATLLCLLIAYPFAFILAQAPRRWRPLLLILVVIPFWTNSLIRAYAIKALITTGGVINSTLLHLGLIELPLELLYTQGAVVLGLVYVLLPFMVLPLYATIEKLDWRLIEAAADLGAGRSQRFLRVVLPLTAPGIVAGSLLVFLPALCLFYVSDLLGGARALLYGNFIKNQFLDARDWPFGAAASMLLTLAMLLLLALYRASARAVRQEAL